MPTRIADRWFQLNLILNLHSHKVLDRGVHEIEDGELAARLVGHMALGGASTPCLNCRETMAPHSKAITLLAMLK